MGFRESTGERKILRKFPKILPIFSRAASNSGVDNLRGRAIDPIMKSRSRRATLKKKKTRKKKVAATSVQKTIVNPFSTGGGGGVFEVKIQSALFTMLLVNGADPIFSGCNIQELHLQTGHKGYGSDDALLISTDSNGEKRKSLWSIKHDIGFT